MKNPAEKYAENIREKPRYNNKNTVNMLETISIRILCRRILCLYLKSRSGKRDPKTPDIIRTKEYVNDVKTPINKEDPTPKIIWADLFRQTPAKKYLDD